jgi:hypothetical protein
MRKIALVLISAMSMTLPTSAQNPKSYWGKYEGELQLQPVPGSRGMKLLKDYTFIDSAGGRWSAPAGYVSDGASIPRIAWSIIGDPWGGDYRNAAIIHDVACDRKQRPWEAVHLTFYYAMLAAGVSNFQAKVMYTAVYHFGPRWDNRTVQVLRRVPMSYAREALYSGSVAPQDQMRVAQQVQFYEQQIAAGRINDESQPVFGMHSRTRQAPAPDPEIMVTILEPQNFAQPTSPMKPDELEAIVSKVKRAEKANLDEDEQLALLRGLALTPSPR